MLTELQSTHIRNDPPAVFRRNLWAITRHRSVSARDDFEQVANGSRTKRDGLPVKSKAARVVGVVVGWLHVAALRDLAVAIPNRIVTDRAEDGVTFLSTLQIRTRQLKGISIHEFRRIAWCPRRGHGAGLCSRRSGGIAELWLEAGHERVIAQ